MRIHEYQAKQILEDFGVPVPPGKVATDPDEAAEIFDSLPGDAVVVKAQSYGLVPSGTQSMALARSREEAAALARKMTGKRFGPDAFRSRPVSKVLVEQCIEAERYLYLAVAMDTGLAKPVMLAAPNVPRREAGTMPVEGVSREVIDPRFGTLSFQWRKVTRALGLEKSMLAQVTAVASGLYRALIECECIEAEIGSLALTAGGELVALEARLWFDSNALFRHEEIAGLCDPAEFSETENALRSKRMRYVALGGRIGCVLFDTGSALVMLDHLAAAGARPGGILYLSGRESAEKMAYGITCLLREESFRALIIEVPRGAEVAGRVVSAIRLAVGEEGTDKQVVALAASDASAGAAEGLGGPEPEAQVVRTASAAAGAVGRD